MACVCVFCVKVRRQLVGQLSSSMWVMEFEIKLRALHDEHFHPLGSPDSPQDALSFLFFSFYWK